VKRTARPQISDASKLEGEEMPVPRSVVTGIFNVGLNMLAGKSKLGKSWLALNVALAVASGGKALGSIEVEEGDVLYLALEDSKRRLQQRIDLIFGRAGWPARLSYATGWPKLDDGGLEELDLWLAEHPQARLIVIDVWKRIRHRRARGANLYDEDYEHLVGLQAMAQTHGVCILVVHHTRKAAAEDVFDEISGTGGVMAALDTCAILHRPRSEADGEIWVTGRDLEEAHLAMRFDGGVWSLLGSATEVTKSKQRAEVVTALRAAKKAITPAELAITLGWPANRVRQRLFQMVQAGEAVRLSNSTYALPVTHNEGKGGNEGNGGNGITRGEEVRALRVMAIERKTAKPPDEPCPNCGTACISTGDGLVCPRCAAEAEANH
jgi:hypothetical protein